MEAWLGPPRELSKGRYWKDVTIHWPSLLKALGLTARPSAMPAVTSRRGRKPALGSTQLDTLKRESFRLLDDHGGLSDDDPDFCSKEQFMAMLIDFAASRPKMFPKPLARGTIQPRVKEWLEEWVAARKNLHSQKS
jgi:hypothetical protein